MKKEEHYDVLVIGAGGAGMTAALQASELGAGVLVIEKEPKVGGNTNRASSGMNAAESDVQLQHGIVDTMTSFYQETFQGGGRLNDPAMLRFFVEHAPLAVDWLAKRQLPLTDLTITGGMSRPRTHRPQSTAPIGNYLVRGLASQLKKRKVPLLTATRVTNLLTANGQVVGVQVKRDGQEQLIKAKAVILATGGFGANPQLISRLRPDLSGLKTTNQAGATGDGLRLAERVGAAVRDLSFIQVHPTVQQDQAHTYLIGEAVRGEGAILVNRQGRRFVNELATRRVVSEAIFALSAKSAWLIFDQAVRQRVKAVDFYCSVGLVKQADNLQQLGQQIGSDAKQLTKTVQDWNKMVGEQRPDEWQRATGRHQMVKAPFYAIHVAPAIHYTMGGLHTDPQTRVLDANGQAIGGLYAAGEVVGGLHGNNRLGGNSIAETVVFGRQAGIQAVADQRH
ncbi:flavocytochrome c [uncultured Limosilactobacillus sp.]|uniref:flavocytochrome c n=1 Tax=uncultured Limosilactobacillus sp. TaxID=2837629 RepID=UPI0025F6ED92|nr:flavocytochrome c [uncultured Limosilactobacillus sp.]